MEMLKISSLIGVWGPLRFLLFLSCTEYFPPVLQLSSKSTRIESKAASIDRVVANIKGEKKAPQPPSGLGFVLMCFKLNHKNALIF